jgi:hypothetical protein
MSEWRVEGTQCYEHCDHVKKEQLHDIVITPTLWRVIRAMCRQFPHDEWQLLLTGELRPGTRECVCNGYYVPKQRVGGAVVQNTDFITAEVIAERSIVAGIHSHVNMPVQPSGTDIKDSVMSLIDYHVIVNNRHELNGMRKATLPCGGVSVVKCDVVLDEPHADEPSIEGLERIERITYPVSQAKWDHDDDEKKWMPPADNTPKKSKRKDYGAYERELSAEWWRGGSYGCY